MSVTPYYLLLKFWNLFASSFSNLLPPSPQKNKIAAGQKKYLSYEEGNLEMKNDAEDEFWRHNFNNRFIILLK